MRCGSRRRQVVDGRGCRAAVVGFVRWHPPLLHHHNLVGSHHDDDIIIVLHRIWRFRHAVMRFNIMPVDFNFMGRAP